MAAGGKNTTATTVVAAPAPALAPAAATATAEASSSSVGLDSANVKPGCRLSTVRNVNNNSSSSTGIRDEDVLEPDSPTTSIASEAGGAPGWAERVGLTSGVVVTAGAAAATTAVRRRSPLGNELRITADNNDGNSNTAAAAVLVKSNGNREVPRFLRPVMVLLTLSLLAIGGGRLFRTISSSRSGGGISVNRGGGGGGGPGLFGPAVYAAGGVQLPEAIVDDIFERADKDHDGVIGDEEIQHVRVYHQCTHVLRDIGAVIITSSECGLALF